MHAAVIAIQLDCRERRRYGVRIMMVCMEGRMMEAGHLPAAVDACPAA